MIKNPLRYPGAKSKLYDYIKKLLETQNLVGCTFYEPFAGSASLSLMLIENNLIKNAVINEKDPLLYHFWHAVFNDTEELIRLINNTEITVENWKEISQYRSDEFLQDKSSVQIGFAGLFLNRTNYSGILRANPLGGLEQTSDFPINCRFNKNTVIESIEKISLFKDQITVHNLDAVDFMSTQLRYKRNGTFFVYIDPPYYKAGPGLYRCFYDHEDHVDLARYIKSKIYPWLISYDNVPQIRKLYKKRTFVDLYWDYSVHTSKKGQEVLISNLEIPPIENASEQDQIELA
jgi:Site-specific DNA methylase